MECSDVQRQLHARVPLDAEAVRHADGCPACAAMIAAAPLLPQDDDAITGTTDRELWSRTLATLDEEQGPVAWLRARSSGVRLALALAVAMLAPVMVLLVAPRGDLGSYPRARLVGELGPLAIAWALAAAVTLRPLQRALPAAWRVGASVLVVLAIALLASLPPAHPHGAAELPAHASFVRLALTCLVLGTLCAIPAWLGLRALAREGNAVGRRAPVLALAATAVGAIAVYLHCAIVHRGHLWAGHATIVLPLLAWAWWHARAPLPRR